MQKSKKIFVAFGTVFVLLCATLSLHPQVLRKRNAPVTTVPEQKATTRIANEQVVAAPETPPPNAEVESRIFQQPRYMDDRLDWCMKWGTDCGKPVAQAFCNRRRYENATAFEAELVGRSAQTRLMGTDQVCNADNCTTFSFITCSGAIGMERVFGNPTWKDYRLDVCWLGIGYCGKWSADAFCRARGFSESLDSTPDREPSNTPTRAIGNNQICEKGCKGYQQIICK